MLLPPHSSTSHMDQSLALVHCSPSRQRLAFQQQQHHLRQLLQNAGIADLFDAILSVEGNGANKPLHSTYQYSLNMLGITCADAIMVSCHDWDLSGGK